MDKESECPFVDKKGLRFSSRPFVDRKVLPLPFFVVLRGPSWTKRCCRCRSSRPFVDRKVLQLPFFVVLSGPSWPFVDKKVLPLQLPFFVVLSGPSRPFVDKRLLPLPFFVVLSGPSWTKRCCRCRSSRSFVALRGQKDVAVAVLRGPLWIKNPFSLTHRVY